MDWKRLMDSIEVQQRRRRDRNDDLNHLYLKVKKEMIHWFENSIWIILKSYILNRENAIHYIQLNSIFNTRKHRFMLCSFVFDLFVSITYSQKSSSSFAVQTHHIKFETMIKMKTIKSSIKKKNVKAKSIERLIKKGFKVLKEMVRSILKVNLIKFIEEEALFTMQ